MSSNEESKEKKPGAGHLLSLYVVTAITLVALALILQMLSAAHIRKLHPGFPSRITLAIYTPSPAYRAAHALGLFGILVSAAIFVFLVVWSVRRNRFSAATAIAIGHLLFLLILVACYALSAIQLAGFAASILRQ